MKFEWSAVRQFESCVSSAFHHISTDICRYVRLAPNWTRFQPNVTDLKYLLDQLKPKCTDLLLLFGCQTVRIPGS